MAGNFPDNLYVQKGFARGSSVEELFSNSTPEKAAQRDLGSNRVAGQQVAVYKLDRIVKLTVGVTEVPVTDTAAAPSAPTTTPTAAAPLANVVTNNT